ncbi:DNA-binding response regulator, OmpR family, contains REC and winged-helix (wHTH) domain [Hymenobacter gelipurpurascens]|uniref:DNA-binding response regulator, OmpR family, contains REC and winged-helix (WHTH) domain n=1 Tax=Hymenobacter gelipurpurascens TaxID=89968 RepID=A0A212TIN5_9BACT|nr:response regulator transcription factor [Hymenobacter gelipurpurascens]SNC65917.1 DNA-binding response regulator, OmpR family, contains REC and winged-helix (wHTH) domain [Hymenobacter gelipurpurascens]
MKLLLVEDEPELLASLVSYLQAQHYVCEVATTYAQAQEKMLLYNYECIVLDLTLPGGDGLELLRELQRHQKAAGVIITSARAAVDDRITGLELGADDYLPKPFYLPELSARISALVRRRHYQGTNLLQAGKLTVDVPARRATVESQPVTLTRTEFDLLLLLLANQGRVITKGAIAEHLSGDAAEQFDTFESVYAHVKNLKRKLADAGAPNYIRMVYGLGYRFDPSSDT